MFACSQFGNRCRKLNTWKWNTLWMKQITQFLNKNNVGKFWSNSCLKNKTLSLKSISLLYIYIYIHIHIHIYMDWYKSTSQQCNRKTVHHGEIYIPVSPAFGKCHVNHTFFYLNITRCTWYLWPSVHKIVKHTLKILQH